MRLNRVMMAALVAVLLGVGIRLAIAYWGRTSPPTAAQQDKQALVDGLAQGQILYIRSEDYSKVRLGPLGQRDYPQRVIDETWVVIGSDGVTETNVGTMRDVDGDLIGHSELKDGVNTYSDLTSGSISTCLWASVWVMPNGSRDVGTSSASPIGWKLGDLAREARGVGQPGQLDIRAVLSSRAR